MRCVRIWFAKEGKVKYISHLDVMRCMSRAVRRARLPLWYTEGFNPHPQLVFALPLSVGMASECELLDFKLDEFTCVSGMDAEKNRSRANSGVATIGARLNVAFAMTNCRGWSRARRAVARSAPFGGTVATRTAPAAV